MIITNVKHLRLTVQIAINASFMMVSLGCGNTKDVSNDVSYVGTYVKGKEYITVKDLIVDKSKDNHLMILDPDDLEMADGSSWQITEKAIELSRGSRVAYVSAEVSFGQIDLVDVWGTTDIAGRKQTVLLTFVSQQRQRIDNTYWRFEGPRASCLTPLTN